MEFPKDEVKNKIVWTKGADFTDGSPRYTFEGCDPATTFERFQVVIYTEMERRYAHDPGSLCNHYYGYVRDDKMECAETIGPYPNTGTGAARFTGAGNVKSNTLPGEPCQLAWLSLLHPRLI